MLPYRRYSGWIVKKGLSNSWQNIIVGLTMLKKGSSRSWRVRERVIDLGGFLGLYAEIYKFHSHIGNGWHCMTI